MGLIELPWTPTFLGDLAATGPATVTLTVPSGCLAVCTFWSGFIAGATSDSVAIIAGDGTTVWTKPGNAVTPPETFAVNGFLVYSNDNLFTLGAFGAPDSAAISLFGFWVPETGA